MKNANDTLDRALTGVVIDPGHGGADGGATGNGIIEKNMTLDISKYMYDRFKELGVPVAITRTGDVELTSATRPQKILEPFGNNKDVIVLSNHINAGGAEGAEVIYALRNSDALSEKILNSLAQEGQIIRKNYQRRLPSNPSRDYYYVLRDTPNTEAVIVEYGFLDNPKDAAKLKANYKDYAEAVVRAVMEYKNLPYAPPAGSNYYTVKKGDTLWTIAKNNGMSVDELKTLNNLTSNTLSVGQNLKLSGKTETPVAPAPSEPGTYYVVQRGDNLYSIARRYNTTVSEIKRLNNLTSDILSIGQRLLISGSAPVTPSGNTYVVKAGDSLYAIARRFGTTVDELKSANNLVSNNLAIGQILVIPGNKVQETYTVVAGDSLYAIARKFGTTVNEIKALNNLSSNNLSIGQKLLIP